jgi:hypothetical protein
MCEHSDSVKILELFGIPPERRNRIIVTTLTENDDYWPQKRRTSF